MRREKAQVAQTARPKVLMRRLGADCFVVVRHRLCRPTANETLRQPSRGGTSRMMRESQVRFCERLGVKFPGPTRHRSALNCISSGASKKPGTLRCYA